MRQLNLSTKSIRTIGLLGIGTIVFILLIQLVSYYFIDAHLYSILLILCFLMAFFCSITSAWILFYGKRMHDLSEMEVIKSHEKYKSIIESSNTGAWEFHSDLQYHWCSREYFELLGLDPNRFLSRENLNLEEIWLDFIHPDDKEIAIKKFEDYLKHDSSGLFENIFRMKHSRGEWLWILSRGKTLRNPDGTKSNVTLGTFIDITDRIDLEIELVKLNEKLVRYAHLNAHKVRGPVARLLGLVEVSRLDINLDYSWFFRQVKIEANDIDKVLKEITKELEEVDGRNRSLPTASYDKNEND